MKKVLSFVLVLAMVLGSVSMAFAKTETFPDVKGLACEEAVNVLAGLGVVQGYPDGEFKPARNITRAEAVKLIVGALAIPVDEKGSYETPFTDVPANEWYAGYVRYANALGITKGTSATEFSPNAMVTSDQMIAFTMRALGYNEAVLQGEYPACFINKAVGLKVLDGVSTGSQAAPRGEIAQLIYNTLLKQIGTVGADGLWHGAMIADPYNYTGEKVDTMLNRLGAYEGEDYVLITKEVMEGALVDLDPYYGAVAKLYYTQDDDEVVAISEVKTTFVEGKLDKGKLDGYKILGDETVLEPERFEDYNDGGIYITNGAEADADEFDLAKLAEDKIEGKFAVTFKNGKINAAYSFQVWTADKAVLVDEDDLKDLAEDEPTIGGYEFELDDDDALDTSKFGLYGVKSLDEIEEDDVVYIYANPDTGKISRIEVGKESVKAEFTKIRGRNEDTKDAKNESEDRYVVGGTTYEASDIKNDCNWSEDLVEDNLGEEVTIYLGYDGKIAFTDMGDKTTTDYVVFLQFWPRATGTADNRTAAGKTGLSVFGKDGREELYFKKNLKLNDVELKDLLDTDEFDEKIGIGRGELVKLTKNTKGEVTGIELCAESETQDVTKKGRLEEDLVALQASSVVYNYSGDDTKDELEDDENYSVVSATKLFGKNDVEFIQVAANSKGIVKGALISGATEAADDFVVLTGKMYTVKDAAEGSFFKDGEKVTLTADEKELFNAYKKPTDEKTFTNTIYQVVKTDADGVITEVKGWDELEDAVKADIALSTSEGLRIENDVLFDANQAPYEIEDGAVFYLFDVSENKWSVVSQSTLKGMKSGEKGNQGITVKAIKTDEDNDGYSIFLILRN